MKLTIQIEPSFRYSVYYLLENFAIDLAEFDYGTGIEHQQVLDSLQVTTERVITQDHASLYVNAIVQISGLDDQQAAAVADSILAGAKLKYGEDKVTRVDGEAS